jgi:hypothetical protein
VRRRDSVERLRDGERRLPLLGGLRAEGVADLLLRREDLLLPVDLDLVDVRDRAA